MISTIFFYYLLLLYMVLAMQQLTPLISIAFFPHFLFSTLLKLSQSNLITIIIFFVSQSLPMLHTYDLLGIVDGVEPYAP